MKVKKLKVKKIYIAIISMCIFTIIMIIFFTTRNIVMQKKLSEEVEILSTMNIMNDDINRRGSSSIKLDL